jgi:hypothetical protein
MEVTSNVEPKTITVTDLDIRFPGEVKELTLFPGDTEREEENPHRLHIHLAEHRIAEGFTSPTEDVVIYMQHVLWIRRHNRVITLSPDKPVDESANTTT